MEAWLPLLLILVSFLYASVGHGGASGYLALLAVLGYSSDVIRPTALVLNLVVSAIAFLQFTKAGHFRWRSFWPFALTSVPFAWLGAHIDLDPMVYKRVLAGCLLIAVARLFGLFGKGFSETRVPPIVSSLFIGALLGLVSGMIGIGGGILLSPLLLVFAWSTAKESAAISAAFIFVNSAAGLLGLDEVRSVLTTQHLFWIGAVLVGGGLGAFVGAQKYSESVSRQVLGGVLLLASVKLFFT